MSSGIQVFDSLNERARNILFHERSHGMTCDIFWNDISSKVTAMHIYFDLDEDSIYYVNQKFVLCTDIGEPT